MKRYMNPSLKNNTYTTDKYNEFKNNIPGHVIAIFAYLSLSRHDGYFNRPPQKNKPIVVGSRLGVARNKLNSFYKSKGFNNKNAVDFSSEENDSRLEQKIDLLTHKVKNPQLGEVALRDKTVLLQNLESAFMQQEAEKIRPGIYYSVQ